MTLMRAIPIAILLLTPLAACGSATPWGASSVTRHETRVELGALAGGGSVMTFDGVRVEVQSDVLLEIPASPGLTVDIRNGDGQVSAGTHEGEGYLADGKRIQVKEGRFVWGDEEYGLVVDSDVVRLSAAGVTINGEAKEPR